MDPRDTAVERIARAQRWVVTAEQLRGAGLTPRAISHRVQRSRLHRIHRGVYSVGHEVLASHAHEQAALLACGPSSVLSHRSAALVWELLPGYCGPVEVTIPPSSRRRRSGVIAHPAAVSPGDRTIRLALPVTSPIRTLVDLGGVLEQGPLERVLGEAMATLGVRRERLAAYLEGVGGRRGTGRLRTLLEAEGGPAFTRSEAERRLLGLIREARLPAPRCNVRVAGYEVDFAWPERRVIVEVDGYAFHNSPTAFEHDHRKTLDLDRSGCRLIRLTWREITEQPVAVAAELGRALAS